MPTLNDSCNCFSELNNTRHTDQWLTTTFLSRNRTALMESLFSVSIYNWPSKNSQSQLCWRDRPVSSVDSVHGPHYVCPRGAGVAKLGYALGVRVPQFGNPCSTGTRTPFQGARQVALSKTVSSCAQASPLIALLSVSVYLIIILSIIVNCITKNQQNVCFTNSIDFKISNILGGT